MFPEATSQADIESHIGYNANQIAVNSLEEYFAYLETIKTLDDKDIYLNLPVDEVRFEIDANSRKINIPTEFIKNGIGVQGDELAEIVYFSVDRFFDTMDLARDDMNIAIQWLFTPNDRTHAQTAGVTKHYGKDIKSIPGKILFGWPIASDLTKEAGTVKFAARFYLTGTTTVTPENGTSQTVNALVYSFSTLPAEVKIQATLDYEYSTLESQDDYSTAIRGRIANSTIIDASIPDPVAPTIISTAGVSADQKTVTVGNTETVTQIQDLKDGQLTLQGTAKLNGQGLLDYSWTKASYLTGSTYGVSNNTPEVITKEIKYVEATGLTPTTLNSGVYYIRDTNITNREVYMPVPVSDWSGVTASDITGNRVTYNGTSYTLFRQIAETVVDGPGVYQLKAISRQRAKTASKLSSKVNVQAPHAPIINSVDQGSLNTNIIYRDGIFHVTLNERSATYNLSASLPVNYISAYPGDNLSYTWYSTSNPGTNNTFPDIDKTIYNDSTDINSEYAIPNLPERYSINTSNNELQINFKSSELNAIQPGKYPDFDFYAKVTSSRNNGTRSVYTPRYRVTPTAPAPVITKAGAGTAANLVNIDTIKNQRNNQIDVYYWRNTAQGNIPNTLYINIDKNIQSDGYRYIWMKMTIEDYNTRPSDWQNDTQIKLQSDIDNLFTNKMFNKAITTNPEGLGDNPVPSQIDGTAIGIWDQDIWSDMSEQQRQDAITGFLTDVTGDTALSSFEGPSLKLNSNIPAGYYYCIIINELNCSYNATVSPFFNVLTH